MAKKLPYMPLYPADFLADTAHLGAAASWAYMGIIMAHWLNRAPPRDDDDELARIARMSPAEWRRTRPALERFFECDERGRFVSWRHKRVEAELEKSTAKSTKRSDAAQERWRRAATGPPDEDANASAKAEQKPCSQSQNHSIESIDSTPVPRARDPNTLLDQLVAAAGGNVLNGAIGIEVVRPITDLIAAGCDLEADVLPAVREVVPKLETPLRTWGAGFLRDAILGRQAARQRGRASVPATGRPLDTEARWRRWLGLWKQGRWAAAWGAPPGDSLCEIPLWFVEKWEAEAAP